MSTVEYQPQLPLVTAVQALDLEENYGSVEGIHFWVMPSTEPLITPHRVEYARQIQRDIDKHNEAYMVTPALEDIFEEQRRITRETIDHAFLCGLDCDGNPHKIDSWKPEGFATNEAFAIHTPGRAEKFLNKFRRPRAYYRETLARRLYEVISGCDFPDE